MEHVVENGIYGMGDIWRFYSYEEAKEHKSECPNWVKILEDTKKYIGKYWLDKRNGLRYKINGKPVYKKYKIIGIEDNDAWADYYWILEDENGNRRHELANMHEFYENII